MNKLLCNNSAQRGRWAVSLCFASATLMSLEALRPGACAWMGLNADQSFALSALIATVSMFLAMFILTQLISVTAVHE